MMELYFEKAMITSEPFSMSTVRKVLDKYIDKVMTKSKGEALMADPFARESFTTNYECFITNDLNEEYCCTYNLEFKDFVKEMGEHLRSLGRKLDLVVFDPPYSLSQLKRNYDNIGYDLEHWQTLKPWTEGKNDLANLMNDGAYFISFGWSSFGMGVRRGFEKLAIYNFEPAGGDKNRYNLMMTIEKKQPTLFKGEDF